MHGQQNIKTVIVVRWQSCEY